ncbi:futalosine hydrolase [Geoalkalibacter ferrihydriticus]|uniref:Futalosine hydrolase n=1 Tax=Geoalkalibacter ferrihydriticus TaxID=392333 RepID=A0A1G9MIE8_9BACT|nr:futalosine hydrolase [Geoalkalibacter ferrihydriticus]SDL74050.1 futalosine hydrolase [Geoalkalibacter ferrihydriticus]
MIALIAATPLESILLSEPLTASVLPGGFCLFTGHLGERSVSLVLSGVGKANAAAATALLLAQSRPEVVISFGCGGAFPGFGLGNGDLTLATAEHYGDEGVDTPLGFEGMRALGFALVQRPEQNFHDILPVSDTWLEKARASLTNTAVRRGCAWREGIFATVSTCSGSDRHSAAVAQRTGALCETMEGAAVAQMCAAFNVPFLGIRGISNLTGNRDRTAWNLPLAVTAAQEAVLDLLRSLPPEESAP